MHFGSKASNYLPHTWASQFKRCRQASCVYGIRDINSSWASSFTLVSGHAMPRVFIRMASNTKIVRQQVPDAVLRSTRPENWFQINSQCIHSGAGIEALLYMVLTLIRISYHYRLTCIDYEHLNSVQNTKQAAATPQWPFNPFACDHKTLQSPPAQRHLYLRQIPHWGLLCKNKFVKRYTSSPQNSIDWRVHQANFLLTCLSIGYEQGILALRHHFIARQDEGFDSRMTSDRDEQHSYSFYKAQIYAPSVHGGEADMGSSTLPKWFPHFDNWSCSPCRLDSRLW